MKIHALRSSKSASVLLLQVLAWWMWASQLQAIEGPRTFKKIPVADLLMREGAPPTDNLLTCENVQGKITCRLRDGDLSAMPPMTLAESSLVRYRYTLECFGKMDKDLSLFAIRTSDQIRRLQYHAQGLKSNIFGPAGSKVQLVLLGDRQTIDADIARWGCWRFTIDEVTVHPVP